MVPLEQCFGVPPRGVRVQPLGQSKLGFNSKSFSAVLQPLNVPSIHRMSLELAQSKTLFLSLISSTGHERECQMYFLSTYGVNQGSNK